MASPQGYLTPSHILYADDIFVFYKADNKSLKNLTIFLKTYGDFSGQYVNNSKSRFLPWIILQDLSPQHIISYSHGCLPFTYLGMPIFVGAPKCRFLQPLADKVKLN